MFGEVYPDPVRVVSIGKPAEDLLANPTAESNRQYSVEFCGGTHLKQTGDATAFALISEEGIAKVCCTGSACYVLQLHCQLLQPCDALLCLVSVLCKLCLLCQLCMLCLSAVC